MSMNIDKSLDDIITTKKSRSRQAPRGGGIARRGAPARAAAIPTGPAGGGQRRAPQVAQGALPGLEGVVGDKIVVSNLPEDVTEQQIKELFTSTVGPLKTASLSYDSKGHSKGIATVQFQKAADATKAYQQYNKRLIDGKRPMKVEIIVDPSRVPPAPLTSRLGVAPTASATLAAASGSARQPRNPTTNPGRVGGGGGRGGRAPRVQRPKATVESLDAEMSDYQAKKGESA